MKGTLQLLGIAIMLLVAPRVVMSQRLTNEKVDLDAIYRDESHCLTGPEIRSDKDSPNSCYCRDAIMEARYVWHTYLLTEKDRNLNGVELVLQRNASEVCAQQYDVIDNAVMPEDWKWNGPEVTRTYPPDSVLAQIKPDQKGWVHYEYTVVLLYRAASGAVTRSESFTAKGEMPLEMVKRLSQKSKQKSQ